MSSSTACSDSFARSNSYCSTACGVVEYARSDYYFEVQQRASTCPCPAPWHEGCHTAPPLVNSHENLCHWSCKFWISLSYWCNCLTRTALDRRYMLARDMSVCRSVLHLQAHLHVGHCALQGGGQLLDGSLEVGAALVPLRWAVRVFQLPVEGAAPLKRKSSRPVR